MIEEVLRERLKDAKRLILLGVGNELNGDDCAGVELAKRIGRRRKWSRKIVVIEAGTAAENFISVIRDFRPSHIIVVDAARMGMPPGSLRILEKSEISGFTFSTHLMSFSFLVGYLEKESNAQVIVVGIEPLRSEMGERISQPVMDGVLLLEKTLIKIFQSIGQSKATGRR